MEYFFKPDDMSILREGIANILTGQFACSGVSASLEDSELSHSPCPREIQALQGLALGKNNVVIAPRFDISANTVDKHRTSIMRKLSVHFVDALLAVALREGIIETARQL